MKVLSTANSFRQHSNLASYFLGDFKLNVLGKLKLKAPSLATVKCADNETYCSGQLQASRYSKDLTSCS